LGYQTVKAQDQELSPEEEIRLVQEFNRMIAEGINPARYGRSWVKKPSRNTTLISATLGLDRVK